MKCAIYDYETLGKDPQTLPILSCAFLSFDTDRFTTNPYSFSELVSSCVEYKFSVEDQVKNYGKKIDQDTLKWWGERPKELRDSQMTPRPDDLPLTALYDIMVEECDGAEAIYTRGNTFDPIVTERVMKDIGKAEPYPWWVIRDTRSMIEGMSYGAGIKNSFIPEGLNDHFIAHDPCHDIAMDVMRLQTLAQAIS
jgi:hypothetical protein